ncbi:hypothetical protein BT63DRAFT_414671 [Microthyrium microscopicum]|uniref:Secreted protein n=1 Tax=Microthyrium microscopicum TaxID=703497 RepID=A0A6A6U8X0_9PEZI|nr:hypothetical protein BT63DRAFT_414671 [Microthyrium microscopicum]
MVYHWFKLVVLYTLTFNVSAKSNPQKVKTVLIVTETVAPMTPISRPVIDTWTPKVPFYLPGWWRTDDATTFTTATRPTSTASLQACYQIRTANTHTTVADNGPLKVVHSEHSDTGTLMGPTGTLPSTAQAKSTSMGWHFPGQSNGERRIQRLWDWF